MLWASVAFGALLLVALLVPILEPRLTRGRRARGAHRGDVVHWYPNYDEDLHFEPQYEHDIVTISRRDLQRFGYAPGEESALVPRTFRGRVAGDHRLRLWISTDDNLRSIWICGWQSAIELPAAAHPASTTLALTREMLVPIPSGPHPRLDDDRSIEMPDSVAAAPLVDWDDLVISDSTELDTPELIHETSRFSCTETTPLSSTSSEDAAPALEAEDSFDEGSTPEGVAVLTRPTTKSKRNRGRRKRNARRR